MAASGYVNGFNGATVTKTSFKRRKDGKVEGVMRQSKPSGVKKSMGNTTRTVPPSGVNIEKKLYLLNSEGVEFDDRGMLINSGGNVLWDGPWVV